MVANQDVNPVKDCEEDIGTVFNNSEACVASLTDIVYKVYAVGKIEKTNTTLYKVYCQCHQEEAIMDADEKMKCITDRRNYK